MTNLDKIQDENRRIRYLKLVVDLSLSVIASGKLSKKEALHSVEAVRESAVKLFPGKGHVFDLVYRPRFLRMIEEVYS